MTVSVGAAVSRAFVRKGNGLPDADDLVGQIDQTSASFARRTAMPPDVVGPIGTWGQQAQ
ncbi:MAG: hypothetical protein HGA51_06145 [Demequinaceae bacterium]|nr:hypothetical protein [Demequinaceae bacterium]